MTSVGMAVSSLAEKGPQKVPHLPDEMLERIFSCLRLPDAATIGCGRYESTSTLVSSDQDEDIETCLRALSALSKASSRFRRIALPVLYSVYPGQTVVPPDLFLRTIIAEPSLGRLVAQLVLDPWKVPDGRSSKWSRIQDLPTTGAIIDYIKRSPPRFWRDEERAALLLLFCPQIKALDLSPPVDKTERQDFCDVFDRVLRLLPDKYISRTRYFGLASESPTEADIVSNLPLAKVTSLTLHDAVKNSPRWLNDIARFLEIRTLQSATLFHFERHLLCYYPIRDLSHLRSLTLHRCSLDNDGLTYVLGEATNLRSLDISFAGLVSKNCEIAVVKQTLDFNRLGDLVNQKLASLRSLRLDDRELDDREEHPAAPKLFPSLKNGPPLQELAINETFLYISADPADISSLPLADMLPPSLRSLIIYRSNFRLQDAEELSFIEHLDIQDNATQFSDPALDKVHEFLRSGQQHCPELSTIRIDTDATFEKDMVEHYGWTCERVEDDPEMERPKVVVYKGTLYSEKDKLKWINEEKKVSLLLRKMR